MSIDRTAGNTSFFKKIGNWFNKNGNTLGRAMQITGSAAMGVGVTGMFIHEMKHPSRSIFGSGYCGCNTFGMFGPMASIDPMGMTGWMNGMGGLFGMNSGFGMGGLFGYGNMGGCTSMMGLNIAAQMGQQARLMDMANPYNNYSYLNNQYATLNNYSALRRQPDRANDIVDIDVSGPDSSKKENYKFSDVDSDQETETGKAFNDKLNGMFGKDFKAKEGSKVELASVEDTNDPEKYKEAVSNIAKSYIAHIDKESGDGKDGVSLEEFIKQETLETQNSKITGSVKITAEYAFKKMDMNSDGKLDWKEYAAAIRTFDTNSSGKIDGVIDVKDYKTWSELLGEAQSNKFDNTIRKNYKNLFGES